MNVIRRKQSGQSLIAALALVAIGVGGALVMYNTGQVSSEKTRLVNAADAAAYSGAVYVARNLNFMAYTNRAMIANHIAVGHFVSYVSWVRYVDSMTSKVHKAGRFARVIPAVGRIINAATEVVGYWGKTVREASEAAAPVLVNSAEAINEVLFFAQRAAKANMLVEVEGGPLHHVMEATAREYASSINVNNVNDMASLRGLPSGLNIAGDIKKLYDYTHAYSVENDDGRIRKMTAASLGDAQTWITKRGWVEGSDSTVKLRKKAATRDEDLDGYLHWWTTDEMRLRVGGDGETLGSGDADVREFNTFGRYDGVPGYYALRPEMREDETRFTLTAFATMPMSEARVLELPGRFTMRHSQDNMAAVARAEVYFERPHTFDVLDDGEYPNLFNPFWDVRLINAGLDATLDNVIDALR